jgi:hypothetical protein
VAEEWRVSLTFSGPSGARHYDNAAIRAQLRKRLGKHITISGEKAHIHLYAPTMETAEEAEQVAREVLGQQSLYADSRLLRWDPVRKVWQDARTDLPDDADPELPATRKRQRRGRRLDVVGDAVAGLIKSAIETWLV